MKDDAERLERCLRALSRQTLADSIEILVVDNGSSDEPQTVVERFPLARLLHECKPGSYAARNLGARRSAGLFLAFTDSDAIPASDWLERGLGVLRATDAEAFVGGRVQLFVSDPGRPSAAELYETVNAFPQQHYIEQHSFGVTANLFVSRQAFSTVGEFDDSLISSGDREWGQRAHAVGVRAIYCDEAVVHHPARRTLGELRTKVRRQGIGESQLRAIRGEPALSASDLTLFTRLPLRSTLRILPRLQPRGGRSCALYAGTAMVMHYVRASHQLRTGLQAMRR